MLTDNAFRACEKDTVLVIDLTIEDLTTVLGLWEVYLNDGVNVEDIGPYPISADGVLNVTLDIDQDSIETTYEIASITYTSTEGRFSCVAPPANISGTVPIEIFRKPDPVIMVDAVSMESHELCGTTQALTVDADNGSGMWTSIPGGVSFNPGPTAEAIDAFIADQHEAYGEYQLTFRSEAGDCYDDDTITIHFYEQPAAPFAGDPKMVFVRNSVQLDADSATAGVGTWSVDSGAGDFADENDPKTWVYGLELGAENRFKWTINNGVCQESNDVVIVSQSEVLSYNGISPDNGDMLNNYLIMRGMRYADRFSISFFNSLGKTVRTIDQDNIESLDVDESLIMDLKEDERVVWDGKNAGGILVPGGTYYYVLQLEIDYKDENGNIEDTGEFEFKDFVVVMRE
jgi:hypothetical protein